MHRLLLTISLSLFLYYDTVAQLRAHGTGVTDSINEKTVNPFSKYLPGYEGLFSKKISIETFTSASATVFNHSLINNDLLTSDRFLGFSNHASLGMDVFGVPFSISYTYRASVPQNLNDSRPHWYNISMDVEKYQRKWKEIAARLQPESLTKSGAALTSLKQGFRERVFKEIKERDKSGRLLDSITSTLDPSALSEKPVEQLSALFFGKDVNQSATAAETKLNYLESSEGKDKDSLMTFWKEQLEDSRDKIRYLEKIKSITERYQASGVLTEMKTLKEKSDAEYNALMKDPGKMMRALGVQSGTGLLKLLSILSQFKMGAQPLPFAASPGIPALANGISAEINIGNKYLAFSTGKIIPVYQESFGMPGAPKAQNSSYWFINFRDGKQSGPHKGFKLTGISGEQTSIYLNQPTAVRKNNIMLASLYAKERIVGNNWLSAEISKTIVDKEQNLFDLSDASFKIRLEGHMEKSGITHFFYYNRLVGSNNGFTEHFLYSNGYETGFSIRLNKASQKLGMYAKGSVRSFSLAGAGSNWRNKDLRAGLSYKLKRNQRLQLHAFSREGYKQYFLGSPVQVIKQQSNGLNADISLVNKRFLGLYNTSFISAGIQQDFFPMQYVQGGDKSFSYSTTYNVLLNQCFMAGENLFQFNMMYNKVQQAVDAFFYNTRLEIEGGGMFKAGKNFTAGAFLVYGYFKNAYENVGIKPSLSAVITKKLNVDVYADLRMNTRTVNPLFDQFINLGCDLRYTLK
jgi:hypothetical protein